MASGAPSVAWLVVRRMQFEQVAGHIAKFNSSPPVRRGFCSVCGTQLTYEHDDAPSEIELTTASLRRPEQFPPTREIWLSEKISWVAVDPALEHFAQGSRQGGSDAA